MGSGVELPDPPHADSKPAAIASGIYFIFMLVFSRQIYHAKYQLEERTGFDMMYFYYVLLFFICTAFARLRISNKCFGW